MRHDTQGKTSKATESKGLWAYPAGEAAAGLVGEQAIDLPDPEGGIVRNRGQMGHVLAAPVHACHLPLMPLQLKWARLWIIHLAHTIHPCLSYDPWGKEPIQVTFPLPPSCPTGSKGPASGSSLLGTVMVTLYCIAFVQNSSCGAIVDTN